jgi:hypothetical protein
LAGAFFTSRSCDVRGVLLLVDAVAVLFAKIADAGKDNFLLRFWQFGCVRGFNRYYVGTKSLKMYPDLAGMCFMFKF